MAEEFVEIGKPFGGMVSIKVVEFEEEGTEFVEIVFVGHGNSLVVDWKLVNICPVNVSGVNIIQHLGDFASVGDHVWVARSPSATSLNLGKRALTSWCSFKKPENNPIPGWSAVTATINKAARMNLNILIFSRILCLLLSKLNFNDWFPEQKSQTFILKILASYYWQIILIIWNTMSSRCYVLARVNFFLLRETDY